jgi:ABC-type cobalamin/Fe3+-siderophores transport system ATPase subunit
MVERDQLTVLMVTHDKDLATRFSDRIILMKDGKITKG